MNNFKLDWDSAPSWAQYAAMDYDGEWFWFECEPTLNRTGRVWGRDEGRCESFAGDTNRHAESLTRRPE